MQTVTKIITFFGTFGTFGAGAYGVSYLLNGYTLGDKLKDKGHELLNYQLTIENETEKTLWKPIVESYLKSGKKFEFDTDLSKGVAVSEDSQDAKWEDISKLKNICSKAVSLNGFKAETESLTESFCMKPVSVKDLAGKKMKVLEANNDSEWDKKINKYLALKDEEKKLREVALVSELEGSAQTNREKFKAACKGLEAPKTYEKHFQISYDHFTDWCVA